MASRPLRRPRLVFAVVVTAWSIALAEVSLGNEVFGLLNPLSWLLLAPVYGGQVLLLASWVFRAQARPTLTALWCAGAVLGLYEFYITGVLWGFEDWAAAGSGGVAWFAVVVIAGFWHPWAAFILPLAIAEQLMAARPAVAGVLPRWLREAGPVRQWVALALLALLPTWSDRWPWWAYAVAVPATAVVIWLASRAVARRPRAGSIRELLPSRAGLWWVGGAVAAVFLVMGSVIVSGGFEPAAGADAADGVSVGRQAITWALYAAMAGLLARNLRHRSARDRGPAPTRQYRARRLVAFCALVVAGAVLGALVPGWHAAQAVAAVAAIWGLGAVAALVMLALAVRGAVARRRPVRPVLS